jgi:ArsR family transcriptional regulator
MLMYLSDADAPENPVFRVATRPAARPILARSMAEPALAPDPSVTVALRALSNPMRLQILQWLRDPERHFALDGAIADPTDVGVCVSHIQAKTGLAQSTVSAYMAELQRAGLVHATRVGKWTHYRRDEQRIAELVDQLGQTL